ncbi:hypothetical protein ACWKW1_08085 [Brevibacillus parabrevis]
MVCEDRGRSFLGDALSGAEKNREKRRKGREVFMDNFFYSRSCEAEGKAVVSLRQRMISALISFDKKVYSSEIYRKNYTDKYNEG